MPDADPRPATRPAHVDELDARILELFAAEPRVGVLEASRRLRVARGTVQARLDKLAERGVVTGWGPSLSPRALGYPVTAFVMCEIAQSGHEQIGQRLVAIPEVLEVHTITGSADLLCRLVARSNSDMQRVIDQLVAQDGIERTSSVIALATQVPYRTMPLLHAAVRG